MPPKFTLFWIVTYCAGLLASVANPLFGAYTYLFEYYLRPGLHWWGREHLPAFRWNLIVSVVLVATYFMRRQSLTKLPPMPKAPARFLVALLIWMVLMSPFAVSSRTWDAVDQYWKLALFHAMVVGTVRSEAAFDGFIALHMLGAGWWGWEAYTNPRREEGRLANVGSGDTLSDNFAAAHLLTVIPFIAVYLLLHRDKRLKAVAAVTGPFVINTFILCNSRGSTVGLLVAVAYSLLVSKSGHRLRMLGAGLALAGAFYVLADQEFIDRQQTTTRYEEDGSATERLASWRGGMRMVADYPLGAGGNGYEELSPVYIADVVEANRGQQRAPHNTYVLVATDWGIPGLLLFLGYCGAVLFLTWQIRKRAPEGGIWYYRALAIELSLIGLMVAGVFADRLYGEAPYWVGALAVVLHRLQTAKLAAERDAPAETTNPAVAAERPWGWPSVESRPAARSAS